MSTRRDRHALLRTCILTSVFAALAFVVAAVFRFNVQEFLTFDLKDAILTLVGLLLGPLPALAASLLAALLEFTVSGTGWHGLIMNFAASASFAVICALVYRYSKGRFGAIPGLLLGGVTMVALMMPLNLLITPLFKGVPTQVVRELIPTLLLPFNAIKGMANMALVLILYHPVLRVARKAGLQPLVLAGDDSPLTKEKRLWPTLCLILVGCLLLVVAMLIFFMVLGGDVHFFLKGNTTS